MTDRTQTEYRLECIECGAEAPHGADGWRGSLVGVEDEVDDVEEVAVYCPACAEREFGTGTP